MLNARALLICTLVLLGASTVLGWFVTRSGITREAAELIAAFSDNPLIQILMVNALLLLVGTAVDVLPALVIVAPVLVPAMVQLGFDPLQRGLRSSRTS